MISSEGKALLEETMACTQRLLELLRCLMSLGKPCLPPDAAEPSVRPKKMPQKVTLATLSEPRKLVLQAIAYYEKKAPKSIIDLSAVRMYFEQHHAAVLSEYNRNILSNALHYLCKVQLLSVVGDVRLDGWRQYRLTPAGKRYSKKLNTTAPRQSRQKE